MLLKVLFWLFVAADVTALAFLFVMGLAAAGPSKTHPLAVVFTMLVVPGVVLATCIALHLNSQSAVLRTIALVVVGAPFGLLAVNGITSLFTLATWTPGSIMGETSLTRALRDLPTDPSRLAEVRTLLAAGADPNKAGEALPLVLAIWAARTSGDTALRLLLDAGADPNQKDEFGEPAWFTATALPVDPSVLRLLLERGADPKVKSRSGHSAVWDAVSTRNWVAARTVIERGASIDGKSPMGLPLEAMLENEVRDVGDGNGLRELLAAVRARK